MSITRALVTGFAATLITLGASAATAAAMFVSTLTGAQEVPPTGSPHTGFATYRLDDGGGLAPSLFFDMLFDPIFDFGLGSSVATKTVTGLHIHQAPRGQNGFVVFGLIGIDNDTDGDAIFTLLADGSTRVTGEWDAGEGNTTTFADLAPIFANTAAGNETPFYLNLHTEDFPGGEIRGQISAVPLPTTLPLLAGAFLLLALRRVR